VRLLRACPVLAEEQVQYMQSDVGKQNHDEDAHDANMVR
jgi:hypothetical protein